MTDLTLNQVLRYLVSGGVFVLTIVVVHDRDLFQKIPVESLGGATIIIAVAFLFGALLYCFHRALVYPWLYATQLRLLQPQRARAAYRLTWASPVSDAEFERDKRRHTEPLHQLTEWADQIHLLYTTSEAIFVALFVDILLPGGLYIGLSARVNTIALVLLLVGVALFVISWWSHRRYLAFEDRLRRDTPSGSRAV